MLLYVIERDNTKLYDAILVWRKENTKNAR